MIRILPITLSLALVATLGWVVCAALGVSVHPREMLIAFATTWIASAVALIPMILARSAAQGAMAQAGLVATVVHLFVCVVIAAVFILVPAIRLGQAYVYWLLPMYWVSLIVLVMMLWALPLGLMREATGCTLRRMWALLLYLPLHWLIMGVLVGGAVLWLMLTAQELRLLDP